MSDSSGSDAECVVIAKRRKSEKLKKLIRVGILAVVAQILLLYEQPNGQVVTNDGSLTAESEWDQHMDDVNDGPTPSSNFQMKRKRKRMGKEKKVGATQRLQNSRDRIVQCIDNEPNITVAKPEDERYSIPRCISLLKDVPRLVKSSPTYAMAVRVFLNKGNRQAFVSLMEDDPETVLPWLSTFTSDDVKIYK